MPQLETKPKAESILDKYQEQLGGRQNFEGYWQSLHDYFYIEAPNINKSYYPGTELDATYLYDSTTLETADVLASGFMNYLTPPTSKWFRLTTKDTGLRDNKPIINYLEDVANEVAHALNKSNFYSQIIGNYKGSGVYGTTCLLEEEDITDDIRFHNIPIKNVCIVEDSRGVAVEFYLEFSYTSPQAADRFGKEKLSTHMQEELEGRNNDKKHKFILFIKQRSRRDVRKNDKENMKIEATWVDAEGKRIVDEGGYHELPVMVHRFDKRPFIPWGFSPGMKALPFARMLNMIAKTNLRAMMKHTDPPIALPENAFIMPFNANPRAVNYYKKTAMDSSKDIFSFANFGDPKTGMASLEYYTLKVKSMMFNDVFLAFENLDKQMNNPEVMERINEKMTMLGPAVGRFTGEVLNPIIIRTIGILWRRKKLPEPPDEFMENPTYEIDYVSQLAQAQRRSELNSLVTALTMTGQMAMMSPSVLDKVNPDKALDEIWNITGASQKVLRSDDEVDNLREQRDVQQQQMQQVATAKEAAGAAKDASVADLNMSKSKQVFE